MKEKILQEKKTVAEIKEVDRLLGLRPKWIECPSCGKKHFWQGEELSHYCKTDDAYGWKCEKCGSAVELAISDTCVYVKLNKLNMRANRSSIKPIGNNIITVNVTVGWKSKGTSTISIKMR